MDAKKYYLSEVVRTLDKICEITAIPDKHFSIPKPVNPSEINLGVIDISDRCVNLATCAPTQVHYEIPMAAALWLHIKTNPRFYAEYRSSGIEHKLVRFTVECLGLLAVIRYRGRDDDEEAQDSDPSDEVLSKIAPLLNARFGEGVLDINGNPINHNKKGIMLRSSFCFACGIYDDNLKNWKDAFKHLLEADVASAVSYLNHFSSHEL